MILYFSRPSACKGSYEDSLSFRDPRKVDTVLVREAARPSNSEKPVPVLELHGNFAYSFDYRSTLDTPFATTNLQLHNERVYADATWKGRYPFRVVVNSRQSNSPYFANYTDANIEFNHQAYRRTIDQAMIANMEKKLMAMDSLDKLERMVMRERSEYAALRNWVSNPARTQEIVTDKEHLYKQVLALGEQESGISKEEADLQGVLAHVRPSPAGWGNGFGRSMSKDSLLATIARKKDSLLAQIKEPTETEKKMEEKNRLADSLYKVILSERHATDSLKSKEEAALREFSTRVRNARSVGELESLEKETGKTSLGNTDKTLLGLTHFNIGRSAINYSDLTVSNISLTGINIEYNPSYYVAFAAGRVDYLFRDFFTEPGPAPSQNLVLGRIGWGDKEKQVFILTVYSGTKNNFGGHTGDSLPSGPMISSRRVFGYSLETKYKAGKNVTLSFEAAKSSSYSTPGSDGNKSFDQAFMFSQHDNEAYSAKAAVTVPGLHAQFDLFYKEIGANFQSYSLFVSGTRQDAWGIKWRQSLLRNQLAVTLQLKKSDFDDPLLAGSYSSSMIFKSAQVVYRRKRWPVFTASYIPSTQLTKGSNGYLSESIYYALTAGIFYDYKLLRLRMNSSMMYSRFFNRGTDTGFISYNAMNVLYAHHIDLGKWHSESDVQYTRQPGLKYWTLQQRIDASVGRAMSVGCGLKADVLVNRATSYWGGSLRMSYRFGRSGSLGVQYDKDYLPNGSTGILPNNWGRVICSKVF